MATPSDADIFEEANRALQGFNNDDNDMDHSDQLDDCLATMTTVKETKERYMAEIERLREEVASMEQQAEREEQQLLEIKMSSLNRIQTSLGQSSSVSGVDQSTLDHLKLQASFTGIQYTDAIVKTIKQDAEQATRQHCLQGQCSGLTFQVDFQVKEELLKVSEKKSQPTETSSSSSSSTARITSLSIRIDDRAVRELEAFVREAERQCDLQPFLRGYGQYAQRFVQREKAFLHFKRQYPEVVTLPQGACGTILKICQQSTDGVVYTVSWDISLSAIGRADQRIQLQVLSSKQMRQLDEHQVLSSAPEKFQLMLKRLGIEKTLDSFIRASTT